MGGRGGGGGGGACRTRERAHPAIIPMSYSQVSFRLHRPSMRIASCWHQSRAHTATRSTHFCSVLFCSVLAVSHSLSPRPSPPPCDVFKSASSGGRGSVVATGAVARIKPRPPSSLLTAALADVPLHPTVRIATRPDAAAPEPTPLVRTICVP